LNNKEPRLRYSKRLGHVARRPSGGDEQTRHVRANEEVWTAKKKKRSRRLPRCSQADEKMDDKKKNEEVNKTKE